MTDFVKSHDSLDVVTGERKNLDVLKLGEGGHSLDGVGGERHLDAGLKLVELFSHLVHRGKLTVESDVLSFSNWLVGVSGFPFLNGFTSGCGGRHFKLFKN